MPKTENVRVCVWVSNDIMFILLCSYAICFLYYAEFISPNMLRSLLLTLLQWGRGQRANISSCVCTYFSLRPWRQKNCQFSYFAFFLSKNLTSEIYLFTTPCFTNFECWIVSFLNVITIFLKLLIFFYRHIPAELGLSIARVAERDCGKITSRLCRSCFHKNDGRRQWSSHLLEEELAY